MEGLKVVIAEAISGPLSYLEEGRVIRPPNLTTLALR